MKKSAKPIIAALLLTLLLITTLVLFVIGIRFKYEELVREKDLLERQLRSELTTKTNLIAEYQMVSAEDIIVDAAVNELGLIKSDAVYKSIKINSSQIRELEKHLNQIYD